MNPAGAIKRFFAPRNALRIRDGVTLSEIYAAVDDVSPSGLSAMAVPAVYACIRVLSETVGNLPLFLYENGDTGLRKARDFPLYDIIHSEPNNEMTAQTFIKTLMFNLLMYGNAYSQIERDILGEVKALYPIDPRSVTVTRDRDGQLLYNCVVKKGSSPYESIALTRYNLMHIKALSNDGIMGLSPLECAATAVSTSMRGNKYMDRILGNSAMPGGILTISGKMDEAAKERTRKNWQEAFSGKGSGKTAVLDEGVKFDPISFSPEQSQYLQTIGATVLDIARIFGVPPHKIGVLDRATFSNIEQQDIDFYKSAVSQWTVNIESEMERSLLSKQQRAKYQIGFNMDGVLRGDTKTRMDYYRSAIQNGIMTMNEVRALENLPTVNEWWADRFTVNGNLVFREDVGAAYKKGLIKPEHDDSSDKEQEESDEIND